MTREEQTAGPQGPQPGGPRGPMPPWMRENPWVWVLVVLFLVGIALLIYFTAFDNEGPSGRATVPAVVGESRKQAESEIRAAGLDVAVERIDSTDPTGQVVSQDPGGGHRVGAGSEVRIDVSRGPSTTTQQTTTTQTTTQQTTTQETTTQETTTTPTTTRTTTTTRTETETTTTTSGGGSASATVPDVQGKTMAAAVEVIANAGFYADTSPTTDDSIARGKVVSQNPDAGSSLKKGEAVRVSISIGSGNRGKVKIPDLVGMSVEDARAKLTAVKLTWSTKFRKTKPAKSGQVVAQMPDPGQSFLIFTQVMLLVGK